MFRQFALPLLSALALAVPAAATTTYTFTRLTPPDGAVFGFAELNPGIGINDAGLVVARYSGVGGYDAFSYNAGTYGHIELGVGVLNVGGVSNAGDVAFDYFDSTDEKSRGAVNFSPGNSFDYPGSTSTSVSAMSPSGLIAGFYVEGFNQYGYVKNGNTFTLIDLPGGRQNYVLGVNDSGDVVGVSACCREGLSYLKQGSSSTVISAGPGTYTQAFGVNNQDVVVGWYDTAPGNPIHGFIWKNGVSSTLDYPVRFTTALHHINSSGVIVGGAADANGSFWFIATPDGETNSSVPEPGTIALSAGAMLFLAVRRRRGRLSERA